MVGAGWQPLHPEGGSQLLTVRQLRWVVQDAPEQRWRSQTVAEQCWLEAKLCWVSGGAWCTWSNAGEGQTVAGGVRKESTPEDRGRTRSATNVNW